MTVHSRIEKEEKIGNIDSIRAGNCSFKIIDDFKYLRNSINSENGMHVKINEKIKNGTRYYFSIIELIRLYEFSEKPKTLLYHSYFRPVITYAYETRLKAVVEY